MQKRDLRRTCFSRVRSLSSAERASRSAHICRTLESLPRFLEASTVYAYTALGSEPDLAGLIERRPDKQWAFPRTDPDGEGLGFHLLPHPESLKPGALGILEPDPETCPPAPEPDLILVPGVGFDPATLARLGRGKGYYDRFLAPLKTRSPRPLVLGVCFPEQLITLFPEPHDVPVDDIVSA